MGTPGILVAVTDPRTGSVVDRVRIDGPFTPWVTARDRPWVLAVLNTTPDSFSDGGQFATAEAAVAHGLRLVDAGADLVDVGGESTRPGAGRVPAAQELARVVPVIEELAGRGVSCSVDTTRAAVAAAALAAGAVAVNDVSGGLADPEMAAVIRSTGTPWLLMHWRGPSDEMQSRAEYTDVVTEVRAEIRRRVDAALAAGVDRRLLVVDPGLGFAKRPAHNWALLRDLDRIVADGVPVLIGASRKGFLGELLAGADGARRAPVDRDAATAAVSLLAAQAGVWGVRVHEPRASRDAFAVLGRMRRPAAQDRSRPADPDRESVAAGPVAAGPGSAGVTNG